MQAQQKSTEKVTQINTQFALERQREEVLKIHRQHKHRIHRWRIMALLVILLLASTFFGSQIIQSQKTKASLEAQVSHQKATLQRTKQSQENLKIQVRQLHDSSYLDKLIRYKYDYSKSGELIFILPQTNQTQQNSNQKN